MMTATRSLSERPEVAKLNSGPTASETLRGWAKAYRETPEHRFPCDPNAEFFPQDLDFAADALDAKDNAKEVEISMLKLKLAFAEHDFPWPPYKALLAQAAEAMELLLDGYLGNPASEVKAREVLTAIREAKP
jgi:hypothetical protein